MNEPDPKAKTEARVLIFASLGLVFSFITGLARTGERESPLAASLSLGIPIVVAICVIALGIRVLGRIAPGGAGRGQTIFFMVLGIVAGMGALFLRLPAQPRAEVSVSFDSKLEPLVTEWDKLREASWAATETMSKTRLGQALVKKDEAFAPGLEETRDFRRARAERIAAADSMVAFLTRPDVQGRMDEFRNAVTTKESVAHARGSSPPNFFDVEWWRAVRQRLAANDEADVFVEEHWSEVQANGYPQEGPNLQPWQREFLRLRGEIMARTEELRRIEAKYTTGSAADK